jgi:16S rRNA (guanine(966)-N(2))-methyltransferase RsmD
MGVRVIAGSARGRQLKGPPGRGRGGAPGVRPSSDLVRGALFDSLAALGADFSNVLDLYAGTGALGIEALSRGGEACTFVEKDRAMAAVIRDNLSATGFDGRAEVIVAPAGRALARLSGRFTLVLADPPYGDADAFAVLENLASSRLVDAQDGTMVYEHSSREEPPADLGGFSLVRSLRHGDSSVSVYRPRQARGGN